MHQSQSHEGIPHAVPLHGGKHYHGSHNSVMGDFGRDIGKMRGKNVTCSHTGEWSEFTPSEILSEQKPQQCRSTKVRL